MSSDDSDSSDSGSSPPPETLVAGRAKRATAGNRLSHLLQHLDDEDIKADLLADQEEDQKDYSASEDEDGDAGFDSSDDSDEEQKEGEDTELAGEKELRKQERVESQRKRKARELVRIQPLKKKVKIAEDASPATPATIPKPERLSLADFGPVRHSSRTQTVANAEVTAARMKESKRRAAKTQEAMRIAAVKKAAAAGPQLTQADRMARALKIEKVNSRSLNRWERSEQERLRIQQEKLEAMRNRKLDGPIFRYWSGPVTWVWREGPDGPVYKRCKYDTITKERVQEIDNEHEERQRRRMQEQQEKGTEPQVTQPPTEGTTAPSAEAQTQQPDVKQEDQAPAPKETEPSSQPPEAQKEEEPLSDAQLPIPAEGVNPPEQSSTASLKVEPGNSQENPPEATQPMDIDPPAEGNSFLDGIHDYASSPATKPQPDNPSILIEDADTTLMAPYTTEQTPDVAPYYPSMPPYIHNPWPHRPHIPLPLLSERAARTLLFLDSFPDLGFPTPVSRRQPGADPAVTRHLLPGSHPPLSAEERRYLSARARRGGTSALPPVPARATCAVSGRPAKFRDPKTRLAYADMAASKAIQRVLANGCQWSALLGVWAGIVGEGSLGRVARGVPEGFWTGKVKEKEQKQKKEVIDIS